jgi:hypothetical protein
VVFENPRQNALRRDKLAQRRPLDEFITMYNNAAMNASLVIATNPNLVRSRGAPG